MEKLNFVFPLCSYDLQQASEWFSNFLKLTKSSLAKATKDYLAKLVDFDEFMTLPIVTKRSEDLLNTPMQSVILSESLIWCQLVGKIIKSGTFDELKFAQLYLIKCLNECSGAQVNCTDARLRQIYSKLIVVYLYQLEMTKGKPKIELLNIGN